MAEGRVQNVSVFTFLQCFEEDLETLHNSLPKNTQKRELTVKGLLTSKFANELNSSKIQTVIQSSLKHRLKYSLLCREKNESFI